MFDRRGTVGALPARDDRLLMTNLSTSEDRSSGRWALDSSAKQGNENVSAFAMAPKSGPRVSGFGPLRAAVRALRFLGSICSVHDR